MEKCGKYHEPLIIVEEIKLKFETLKLQKKEILSMNLYGNPV